MEPFARRPIERTSARRPMMGGPMQRPLQSRPAAPISSPVIQPKPPSLLKPPTTPTSEPSLDIPPVSPAKPIGQRRPQTTAAVASDPPKHHKTGHPTAHAGLVGFIVFLLIGVLCLVPLLPGKIWEGAPGSSDSFSTGDQNLDCLTTLGPVTTATTYDHKIGFPVVYSYATTSQQSAICQGKTLRAIGGHTTQFNPLGLLIDLALALLVAIATAKIWRKLRARKD